MLHDTVDFTRVLTSTWSPIQHLKNSVPNTELIPKVDNNVEVVMQRLKKIAVSNGTNNSVDELIKRATASQHLCYMPPTWQPWL